MSNNELKNIEHQRNEEKRAKEAAEAENARLRKTIDANKLKLWKIKKITIWTVIMIIAIACGLLIFIWRDKNWNFMSTLVSWIDGLGDSSAKQYGNVLVGLPIVVLGYAGRMIIDALDVDEYNKQSLRLFWISKKS